MRNLGKLLGLFSLLTAVLTLSGCKWDVLNPAGYIAKQELILIAICVGVMLCVVVPVMIAVIWFAIKYRASNKEEEYLPDWGHSNKLEAYMWGIPIVIVVILATMTAYYTHLVDPYKKIAEDVAGDEAPLQIDVVALNWKWLFIYPEQGIATINEIYAPKGRQVLLQVSAESSVNAFWVPRLGSMIYAMPQMNAKLHLIADQVGQFNGVSNGYSGDGFAHMRFKWNSVEPSEFDAWVAKVRADGQPLNEDVYAKLRIGAGQSAKSLLEEGLLEEGFSHGQLVKAGVKAKEDDSKVRYFSNIQSDLYWRVVNRCVGLESTKCNENLMAEAAAKSLWGELCSVLEPDLLKAQ